MLPLTPSDDVVVVRRYSTRETVCAELDDIVIAIAIARVHASEVKGVKYASLDCMDRVRRALEQVRKEINPDRSAL